MLMPMNIAAGDVAVLAQIYPVAYLVVAFESRSLRYYRSKGTLWFRHTLMVLGLISLVLTLFAEVFMVLAVASGTGLTGWFAVGLVYVAGSALVGVVGGMGVAALFANTDPNWTE